MKKLLAIFLTVFCVLYFSACDNDEEKTSMTTQTVSGIGTNITVDLPLELTETSKGSGEFHGKNDFSINFLICNEENKDMLTNFKSFEEFQEDELNKIKEDEYSSNLECKDIDLGDRKGKIFKRDKKYSSETISTICDYWIQTDDGLYLRVRTSIHKGNEVNYNVLDIIESIKPVEE